MPKKLNADIYQELNAVPLLDYLENYIHNWTLKLHHMNRYKIPRKMKNYSCLMERILRQI